VSDGSRRRRLPQRDHRSASVSERAVSAPAASGLGQRRPPDVGQRARELVVDLDSFRTNLERIAEVAEQAGTRVLFLDYPLRPLALGEHPHFRNVYQPAGEPSYAEFHQTHDRYQQLAAEVARVRKVPFIETRPRMVEFARNAYSTMDFVHPNNVGAEIIAGELLEALLELGWLRNTGGD
jgi:lysophospholipase L1-like esterase